MTNDPSIWTGYPEEILLDKSLSYTISLLSTEKKGIVVSIHSNYLYAAAHDKTKYWLSSNDAG